MTATIFQQTSLPTKEPQATGGLGSSPVVQSLGHSAGGEGLTREELAAQKASTVLKPTGGSALPSNEIVRETADLRAAGASGIGGGGGAEIAKANISSEAHPAPVGFESTHTELKPTGATALPSSAIVRETADLHDNGVSGIGGGGPKEIAAGNLGTLPSMPVYPASKTGEGETPGRQLPGAWLDNKTNPAQTSIYDDANQAYKDAQPKIDEYVHAAEAAAAGAAAVAAGTATGLYHKLEDMLGYGNGSATEKEAHDKMARVAPIAAGVASDITGHGKNDYTFGPESGNTSTQSLPGLAAAAEQRPIGSSPLAANSAIGAGAAHIDNTANPVAPDGLSKKEALALGGAGAAMAGAAAAGAHAANRSHDQNPVSGVTTDGHAVTPAGAAAAINNMSGAPAGKENPTPKVHTNLATTGASALPLPAVVSDIAEHVHDPAAPAPSTGASSTNPALATGVLGMPALVGVKENPDRENPDADPHLAGAPKSSGATTAGTSSSTSAPTTTSSSTAPHTSLAPTGAPALPAPAIVSDIKDHVHDGSSSDNHHHAGAVAAGAGAGILGLGALGGVRENKESDADPYLVKDGASGAPTNTTSTSAVPAGRENPTPKVETTLQGTSAPALPAPGVVEDIKDHVHDHSGAAAVGAGTAALGLGTLAATHNQATNAAPSTVGNTSIPTHLDGQQTKLVPTGNSALPAAAAVDDIAAHVHDAPAPTSSVPAASTEPKQPTKLVPSGAPALPAGAVVADIAEHVHDPSTNTTSSTGASSHPATGTFGLPALTGVRENPDSKNPNADPHLTSENLSSAGAGATGGHSANSSALPPAIEKASVNPSSHGATPASPSSTTSSGHAKKASFGAKLKGEMKILSGKMSHDEEKIALGEKMKAGEA